MANDDNKSLVDNIQDSGCVLKISEYGNLKRQYHDTNVDRFLTETRRLIEEHLKGTSAVQNSQRNEVKNIIIQIYTY